MSGMTGALRYWWLVALLMLAEPARAVDVSAGGGSADRDEVFDNRHNDVTVRRLPGLEVSEGQGVSAPYAGVSAGRVIVAGGCNFPGVPAADGGAKVYYDDIFVSDIASDSASLWKRVGRLPFKAAYGVSVTTPRGVVCVGGSNGSGALRSAWLLRWDATSGTVVTEPLPDLPVAMEQMAGGVHGDEVYVAGGNIDGVPGNRCFVLRMGGRSSWRELAPMPGGGRVQPVGVVCNAAEEARFFVMGGFMPPAGDSLCQVYDDGFAYNPRNDTWEPVAPVIPYGDDKPAALVGGSAFASGSHHIAVVGGVDYDIFRRALNGPVLMERARQSGDIVMYDSLRSWQDDYMRHPSAWYRFNDRLLIYHTITDTWVREGYVPELALAGAAAVPYGGECFVIGGESKPGVRSAGVYALDIETRTDFGWVNWAVLAIYLSGMLLLGYCFMRRSSSSDDFFKGGGRIPWWAAGISIYATMLSAITYMAIPAKAFATNWTYYPMLVMILVVSYPVIKYYLPFFRRLNVTSAYEYLQLRFNYTVRLMASLLFIAFMVARTALVLYLPSLALTTVTGIDIYICIILMGVVTVVYCTMGGVEAVVWGDVIQGFILVGGAFFAAGYLIFNTEGGIGGFIDIAVDNDKFRMFEWSFDCTKAVFWVVILGGLANNLISYTSDQTVIQRYLTTKDEKAAGKGIMMNGLMSVFISVVFYLIGTGLYTFFKSRPQELDYALSNGDAIFPFFMMSQMPVGVAGLLIAAIFAATMSTIASNINSTATAFSVDIYRHWKRDISDSHMLKSARWASLAAGVAGTVLAVMMATWDILSLLDYFNSILGLLAGGLGGLFLMGIFFDRIGAKGALVGFVSGTVAVFVLSIYTPVSFLLYGAIGIVVSVAVALIYSLVWPAVEPKEGLTWKRRIRVDD